MCEITRTMSFFREYRRIREIPKIHTQTKNRKIPKTYEWIWEKITLFSHLRNGKKKEIKIRDYTFFKLVCIHLISIPRFIGTPRARSNIAQKRRFRMTKFRNNAFSGALYRLFFFIFRFSSDFTRPPWIVAHRRSRRSYLARERLISQNGNIRATRDGNPEFA